MGRMTTTYQAFGKPEQKVTAYTYNSSGCKEKIIKFDGTVIAHTYDPLDRIATVFSTDKTVEYTYEYDLNDNVICVNDLINGTSTKRQYDIHNYLTEETLGNHQCLTYANDHLGRITNIALPDGSNIAYEYHGTRLKNVKRLSANSKELYRHSYTGYDQTGKVTEATLPNNTGKIHYTYDKGGRLKNINTTYWNQTIDGYDKSGNIIGKTTNVDGIDGPVYGPSLKRKGDEYMKKYGSVENLGIR